MVWRFCRFFRKSSLAQSQASFIECCDVSTCEENQCGVFVFQCYYNCSSAVHLIHNTRILVSFAWCKVICTGASRRFLFKSMGRACAFYGSSGAWVEALSHKSSRVLLSWLTPQWDVTSGAWMTSYISYQGSNFLTFWTFLIIFYSNKFRVKLFVLLYA